MFWSIPLFLVGGLLSYAVIQYREGRERSPNLLGRTILLVALQLPGWLVIAGWPALCWGLLFLLGARQDLATYSIAANIVIYPIAWGAAYIYSWQALRAEHVGRAIGCSILPLIHAVLIVIFCATLGK